MNRSERIQAFTEEIWQWFDVHKRILPWRDIQEPDDTKRAYMVLVSEIMLQQTQVPRVISAYKRFLEVFPDIRSLSAASDGEVIQVWRGMGYNSRALRLRDAAKCIVETHSGVFPSEMNELLYIKGIGGYTAAAVRNFAFYIPTPCIDTNIRRILHRVFFGPERADGTWPHTDKELLALAAEILKNALSYPERSSADWHAALMDFGSLVCTKRSPKWDVCPLTRRGICKAAYRVPEQKRVAKKEPGRLVGSTFVPNRIFRGRIVEALRDEPVGLSLASLGRSVCIDWDPAEHEEWLSGVLKGLVQDGLIRSMHSGTKKYALPH